MLELTFSDIEFRTQENAINIVEHLNITLPNPLRQFTFPNSQQKIREIYVNFMFGKSQKNTL